MNNTVEASRNAGRQGAAAPSARAMPVTSQSVPVARHQCGRRAANSLMPNSLNERADSQKASGGLPQKGVPGSNQGVIQSPLSTISRAISA